MKIDRQRLRLKLYHIIGKMTGNYSLENRLVLRIKEQREILISLGIIYSLIIRLMFQGVAVALLSDNLNKLSNPIVGKTVLRRLRKGKMVPVTIVSNLLKDIFKEGNND